jgi:hypothetical protein
MTWAVPYGRARFIAAFAGDGVVERLRPRFGLAR